MWKYSTMKGDSNIAKFLPLQVLVVGYLILTVLYIVTVTGLPAEWNLQYIHGALGNHPFLTDILKGFLALSAVAIAWQRSIATEYQIKLQTNSNRISDYYNIKEHFYSQMKLISQKNNIVSIKESNIEVIFSNIFRNPVELDFSCTEEFEDAILTFMLKYPKKSSFEKLEQLSFSRGERYRSIYSSKTKKTKNSTEMLEVMLQLQDYFNAIGNLPISSKEKNSFNVLNITAKN